MVKTKSYSKALCSWEYLPAAEIAAIKSEITYALLKIDFTTTVYKNILECLWIFTSISSFLRKLKTLLHYIALKVAAIIHP